MFRIPSGFWQVDDVAYRSKTLGLLVLEHPSGACVEALLALSSSKDGNEQIRYTLPVTLRRPGGLRDLR